MLLSLFYAILDYFMRKNWPDVIISILCDFRLFYAKKLAVFSKTNVVINFFHKLALFLVKNTNPFADFFCRNLKNPNIGPWSRFYE
jgi:hypothetical protein